jgi:competence protein ComGC
VDSSRDAFILITMLLVAWIFSIIFFIQARRMRDA